MRSLFYLLCFVLFTVAVHSDTTDRPEEKVDPVLLTKTPVVEEPAVTESVTRRPERMEDEDVDDNAAGLSSYADSRYTAFDQPDPVARTRPRWSAPPMSSDQTQDTPDWSRYIQESRAPPAFPMGNSPVFNNQQKCHSLVDANYPLFADVCGAVPQARYSLPNAFGHRDRWQITQFLHGMISSSNDATCTRSLKLLMCPLLFPTCPPSQYQASSMLPCQSYCRAVKARCANPALDYLQCESLPFTSDLCPTSQVYGSLLAPNSFPSRPQPFTYSAPAFPSQQAFSYYPSVLNAPAQPSNNIAPTISSSPMHVFNMGQYANNHVKPQSNDLPAQPAPTGSRHVERYSPPMQMLTEGRPAGQQGRMLKLKA